MIRLTCACGHLLEVDSDQGSAAVCQGCGRSLGMPRLGILVPSAPVVPAQPAARPRPSTPIVKQRRGGWLAATMLVVLAAAGAGYAIFRPYSQSSRDSLPELIHLAWNPGQSFRQRLTCETRQHFKSPRQEGDVSHQHDFASLWIPAQRPGSAWCYTQKLERVELHMKSGFQTIHFDSSRPGDQGAALAQALHGARLDLDLRPDGGVRDVKGTDELLRKVEATAADLYLVLEACLNAEAQKYLAESLFGALPNREVKVGDAWVRQRRLPPMLGGRLAGSYHYTFEGAEGRLARIRVAATLGFQSSDATVPTTAGVANHLKGNLTGAIWFDPDKRRIARSAMERTIEGNVRIGQGEESTWVEIKNTQKATVEISDVGSPLSQ
jgi:hypothetical protein